ncbi:MAG TPA: hypothetical protein VLE44_02915 [Candidatus Saccharimonadales bacterium]|nr:hypothetical protein [Candidatus Saccharimonadales bacterium]
MAVEQKEIELLCCANCPFDRKCGQNYIDEEAVCVESIDSVIDAINVSLETDSILDTERPLKEYSELRKGEILYQDGVPLTVMLDHEDIRIGFGEIEQGIVKVYSYTNEIYERIKNTAPVVKTG